MKQMPDIYAPWPVFVALFPQLKFGRTLNMGTSSGVPVVLLGFKHTSSGPHCRAATLAPQVCRVNYPH